MRALSVHIGLKKVDPGYGTWNGVDARFCENDAVAMYSLAVQSGFEALEPILTEKATKKNVCKAIEKAYLELNEGDVFWLSFAGHGFRRPNQNTSIKDDFKECWIVYDDAIIDSELHGWLAEFREGVRVIVVSESCNSGGMIEPPPFALVRRKVGRAIDKLFGRSALEVPAEVVEIIVDENYERFRELDRRYRAKNSEGVKAMVILFAACRADQLAYIDEAAKHGLFTTSLLREVDGAESYRKLGESVRKSVLKLESRQSPDYRSIGVQIPGFEESLPFEINRKRVKGY